MAKKARSKSAATGETAPHQQPPPLPAGMGIDGMGMPGGMPGYAPTYAPQPQPGYPGYPPQPGYAPMPPQAQPGMPGMPNPMQQMVQLMQLMVMNQAGGIPGMTVDAAAQPFRQGAEEVEEDGLAENLIYPAQIKPLLRDQESLPAQELFDILCLKADMKTALGGLPKGCTIAFAGPPGKGKSRTCIEAMARLADSGVRVGYIVAEEGFRDPVSGRDDLCSRMTKIGMAALGMNEKTFQKNVLKNVVVLEATYHRGLSWDEFIVRYRTLIEREKVEVTIIDSVNTLDPTKRRTADNLAALKTYNHAHGVTCVTVGQIKDTGEPQGGEALMHTADVVWLIEEMSLTSKEQAEFWGGSYREKIDVIRNIKSVTTPTFPYPIRLARRPETGALMVHPDQPEAYAVARLSSTASPSRQAPNASASDDE